MPPSSEDSLGRRRFVLHRDKAVEHAIERIRRNPGSAWETLTPGQHAAVKSVLAGVWESCGSERWQEYTFSTVTKAGILRLLAIAEDFRSRHLPLCNARGEIEAILLPSPQRKREE